MTDRMRPLDAIFLYTENGITHMHIASCAIFEGPPPTIEEMTRLIESKLPRLVRYRQKVRFVPGDLACPVWVDDPHFNLAYHVRHTALPPPGGEQDLENLMGRLMSQELDRHRPLWEAWFVEGLTDNRWALISKVHHCMVDGVSGTDLMAVMLDPSRDTPAVPIEPWTPRREPSDLQLAIDAMTHLAFNPARHALEWLSIRPTTKEALTRLGEMATGLRSLGGRMVTQSMPLSIEGSIGPHRRWAGARCSLDDVKKIREAFGGSVNDVVLAVISGAFRSVLIARGEPVDSDVVLRTLVPVSVRRDGDSTPNNQVSLIIAELPIGITDPVMRLDALREQMQDLKASHQPAGGEAVVAAADLVPTAMLAMGARATMTMLRRVPQRAINTVTTNVPGPRLPLYALGREMIEYLPFVPLSEGIRIGVAIMSYNGRLSFGITGDYDEAPDVRFMADQIEAEVSELRKRAARHPRRRSTRS